MSTARPLHPLQRFDVSPPMSTALLAWTRSAIAWFGRLAMAPTQPERMQPLRKNATTWVKRPRGRLVTCKAGTLWLCFDGDAADIVLEAGQSHRCRKASALSIHALTPAVVAIR